ncbi:hypothetical protein [Bradyrhizobium pachyrhizi]|uniref:hypothetical protein n=1 Tax=Bradyrhizobium pachyrhizi TaxID=280333 RepID=UPI00067BCE5F|nr:hypothetical protein [Bradyrhizobium pachyrhizi]
MNERARRRVLRQLAGSMLMSNLTRAEIIEIADEMAHGRLGYEFGEMLRYLSVTLPEAREEVFAKEVVSVSSVSAAAREILLRKKLSKKALLLAIANVAPRLAKGGFPNGSVRELLDWFFESASPTQATKLLGLLGDEGADPFLKGIVRRG